MSILVWAAIMIVFVVAVVFVKKLPVQYALMVGPFIIALLMGYSVPETVDFFLAQFNGTMKSAGLMIVFSILYFGLLTETGFFSTVGNAVFRLTKGKMNIYAVMAKVLGDHLADLLFCRLQQCGGLRHGQQLHHAQGPSSFWLPEFFRSSWYNV